MLLVMLVAVLWFSTTRFRDAKDAEQTEHFLVNLACLPGLPLLYRIGLWCICCLQCCPADASLSTIRHQENISKYTFSCVPFACKNEDDVLTRQNAILRYCHNCTTNAASMIHKQWVTPSTTEREKRPAMARRCVAPRLLFAQ